jgi:hypothetical protein
MMSDKTHFHVTSYGKGTTSAKDDKKSLWDAQVSSSFHYGNSVVWHTPPTIINPYTSENEQR